MTDWKDNLLDGPDGFRELLAATRRIAVLGIRSERFRERPAHFVPAYLVTAGFEVIPVPVYEPEVTSIFGKPVYRKLSDVPGEIDLVDVFRRAEHLMPHLDDLLATRPRAVWLQSGIFHLEFAERLARSGIKVVQNRCLMVEHRRFAGSRPG